MDDKQRDNKQDKWHTLAEAEGIFGKSRRTIQRRIVAGEIESKKVGGIVYVKLDTTAKEVSHNLSQMVEQLRSENEELKERLKVEGERHEKEADFLRQELAARSERQDTIILQLTRQLEQSQHLLEYNQEPWYQRWFRKRRTGEAAER